jgi:TolB-like protein/DNA-binding winged helix-turn-helix (wHTH) protein/Tfp pilus assembly protein PilF
MTAQTSFTFRFADIEVREPELRVIRSGESLAIEPKAFRVLIYLLRNAGRLVPKEELLTAVWGDTAVTDNSLTRAVALLRRMLDDDPHQPRFIETVSTAGYRFICPVDVTDDSSSKRSNRFQALLPKRRITVSATGALIALVAALLAFNVAGLRDSLFALVHSTTATAHPQIRALAVLPFEDLSGNQSQAYFADGMTEELITNLASISSVRVISRASVMRFKGNQKPLPEIAKELNVDGIIEGTVARSGNHIRITANLLYAPADRHLWANSYDSDLDDVLVAQDKVAHSITDALRIALAPQGSVPHPRRVNPEAYDAYLQGRYLLNKWNEGSFDKATTSFRRSIDLDPAYAPAYAGLADVYVFGVLEGAKPSNEVFPLAKAAALKAVELDTGLGEAHAVLGQVKYYFDWDAVAAEQEFKRAVQLSPNSSIAHFWYGAILTMMCRWDEAVKETQLALELDPLTPDTNLEMAYVYYYAGRFDDAIKQLKRTLALDPSFGWAHMELGWNFARKQMYPQAILECERALTLNPEEQVTLASCGLVYGQAGKRKEAMGLLDRLMRIARHSHLDPYNVAWLYTGLNDTDNAIAWFDRAYQEHDAYIYGVQSEFVPDRLRFDPRFQDLLRRMNVPVSQACVRPGGS